jgi:hypothetical protein
MVNANSSSESLFNDLGVSTELITQLPDDLTIWENLKQAIAASSGFQRWQQEHSSDRRLQNVSPDLLIRHYLRDTLETLAY